MKKSGHIVQAKKKRKDNNGIKKPHSPSQDPANSTLLSGLVPRCPRGILNPTLRELKGEVAFPGEEEGAWGMRWNWGEEAGAATAGTAAAAAAESGEAGE